MIPVVQTKTVIKNSKGDFVQRGNCYAAVVASIMELPITEIPNVEVFFHLDNGYHQEVMMTFLESKGWELMTDERFMAFHFGFQQLNNIHLQGLLEPEYDRIRKMFPEPFDMKWWKYHNQDKYYIISGDSPRGVSHVCIFQNGKMVHDPHLSHEGLLNIKYIETLEKK